MRACAGSLGNRCLAAVLGCVVIAMIGCGGKQSVASKSAQAYREALAQGVPIGKGEHGGHETAPAESERTTTDHSGMAGLDHLNTPATNHSHMPGMQPDERQHGQMGHGEPQQGPMRQGQMQHGQPDAMAGMQHGAPPAGQPQHGAMMPHTAAPPAIEAASAQARPGQPAATLKPDPLDSPSPTSVADAARSAEMAQMMAPGEHAMAHREYVHRDVGRDSSVKKEKQ